MSDYHEINLDAEACAREQIHIPGSIQSHGLFFALRGSDFTILQISQNIESVLGIDPSELIHQPLSKLMPLEPVERAARKLGDRSPRLLSPIPIKIMSRGTEHSFDGIIHRSGRILILELEPHVESEASKDGFGAFYETVREIITKLMVAESLEETLSLVCREIRCLTEFDRVLVYKFDEDWHGTVISESSNDNYSSLMHHRFPAADIPAQARELYTTNWLRIISDVNYSPSPIVPPLNPLTDKPIDLSNSVLRSVSPIHLEYMRNMGQTASMSISLLKNKKLWGLISCHNKTPKYLSYNTRVAAEFIGQVVSAQIESRSEVDEFDRPLRVKRLITNIAQASSTRKAAALSLANGLSDLMHLAASDGVSIVYGEFAKTMGSVPSERAIKKLSRLIADSGDQLLFTSDIRTIFPAYKVESFSHPGFISAVIDGSVPIEIIWFRKETKETIPWSGNPFLSKERTPDGRIRPRKSFETYLQRIEGKSRAWSKEEIGGVRDIYDFLKGLPNEPDLQLFGAAHPRNFLEHTLQSRTVSSQSTDGTFDLRSISLIPNISFALVNAEGRVKVWTKQMRSLTGFEPRANSSDSIHSIFSDNDNKREIFEKAIRESLTGKNFADELWIFRQDGTSFWGSFSVGSLGIIAGENLFTVEVLDKTLEREAADRLLATKASAEAANKAKSAFLANMSHEIRTPLGAVLGFADLLNSSDQTQEERNQAHQAIKKNGAQLLRLINDLLDMNKIEANRLEIESIEFDLPEELRTIADTFKLRAAESKIAFSCSLSSPIPTKIKSDPTRIKQILTNLVGNAIKFTKPGGSVSLDIYFNNFVTFGSMEFRVRDSGEGMSENQMAKLFQPFVQADVSTTRKFGGTGLGLYVSQKLARGLGGSLSIEKSELGIGSCFLFTLQIPLSLETAEFVDHLKEGTDIQSSENQPDNQLSGLRILLTDDSPDNRNLIGIYLKKAGALVSFASNGAEGVELAKGSNFDIVLMDIQMPVMDGNQAMRELSQLNYRKPVIALTAHALKDERTYSLAQGFSAYITKPVSKAELIKAIEDLT